MDRRDRRKEKYSIGLDWSLVTVHLSHLRGAVSSAVEHLVYTEGVGGSKPSPPSFQRTEVRSQRSVLLLQQLQCGRENNFLPFGVGFGGGMKPVLGYERFVFAHFFTDRED